MIGRSSRDRGLRASQRPAEVRTPRATSPIRARPGLDAALAVEVDDDGWRSLPTGRADGRPGHRKAAGRSRVELVAQAPFAPRAVAPARRLRAEDPHPVTVPSPSGRSCVATPGRHQPQLGGPVGRRRAHHQHPVARASRPSATTLAPSSRCTLTSVPSSRAARSRLAGPRRAPCGSALLADARARCSRLWLRRGRRRVRDRTPGRRRDLPGQVEPVGSNGTGVHRRPPSSPAAAPASSLRSPSRRRRASGVRPATRHVGRHRRGDQYLLGVRDHGGQPRAAYLVQLGEHVVEDQHRLDTVGAQQPVGPQPQRQRERPRTRRARRTPSPAAPPATARGRRGAGRRA